MSEQNLTRRSFLAASAAFSALSGLVTTSPAHALTNGPSPEENGQVKRIRTCCRGCGKMECGVWVTVKDGRAIKIEGDTSGRQSMGNCCTKSMASLQACYHPDRLKYPMKRTRPKGEDPGWVRISWEEALSTSAAKFKELKQKYGGESLFALGGTSRVWSMQPYAAWKQLFESPNAILAWQICKGPRHFATKITDEFAYSWMSTVDRPSVYVQWGGSPEISNYDDSGRVSVDVVKSAKHYINVNPRLTNLGKEADIWLPLRPSTDAAMALAWTDVVIKNKLYDELYCKRWTNGPFLVCRDIEPTGFPVSNRRGGFFDIKTRLLKESDIKEGGDAKKFMVWNQKTKSLAWFSAETGLWEGENEFHPQKAGIKVKGGFLPTPTKFPASLDPALFGEFEVRLKNGPRFGRGGTDQLCQPRRGVFARKGGADYGCSRGKS